jgi:hypothetical protein
VIVPLLAMVLLPVVVPSDRRRRRAAVEDRAAVAESKALVVDSLTALPEAAEPMVAELSKVPWRVTLPTLAWLKTGQFGAQIGRIAEPAGPSP